MGILQGITDLHAAGKGWYLILFGFVIIFSLIVLIKSILSYRNAADKRKQIYRNAIIINSILLPAVTIGFLRWIYWFQNPYFGMILLGVSLLLFIVLVVVVRKDGIDSGKAN